MRSRWSEKIKQLVRPAWYKLFNSSRTPYTCPICGYKGPFKDKFVRPEPRTIRTDSKCLGCGSTERHRLIHLVMNDLAKTENFKKKTVLHIAPEDCLGDQLKSLFGGYETADLFMKGVDHKEDLQNMSFPDATYDWVVISRVLTEPPLLEPCLNELRRILKPGGAAVVAEIFTHEKTVEFGKIINERAREIGVDLLDMLRERFTSLDLLKGDRYPAEYQLMNRIVVEGEMKDDFPEEIREPGVGFKDMIVIARV
ncbi:class I SAM-dependent methyltransferase [Puniceicoccales bacterium CK1056]|uniref:Class I SAM-dependent methyltransferase n=1 Tax=Oceanipulchritudo coccoides TaxID=2706888 RepID=A0A6B2M1S1_9BACT|nr:class I SAM-dependent methyltransferase [Oceanipulchritudo coccoides]NDV61735.1 class I SAM-dependent methyltransferase [Oceanipulchritudo coccoides]